MTAPPDKTIEAVVGKPVAWRWVGGRLRDGWRHGSPSQADHDIARVNEWRIEYAYTHPAPALTAGDLELVGFVEHAMNKALIDLPANPMPPDILRLCALVRRLAPGVTG